MATVASLPAIGARAPEISLPSDDGTTFRLSAQRGHPVLVYFYPQDETEGCTIENIEFTALAPDFAALGVIMVGISPDSIDSHCRFRAKRKLLPTLLSDTDAKAAQAYGVWGLKKTFGHEYIGLKRATFLINADGKVASSWLVKRIKGHAAAVLVEATRSFS